MEDKLRTSESMIRRYGLRTAVEMCCATCRYFDGNTDEYGHGECMHPSTQSHGDYNGPLVFPQAHQVCDLWEAHGMSSNMLRQVVRIPRERLETYNRWMASGADELNDEQRKTGVVQYWTTTFKDGVQADVRVCCHNDGQCWCEVVWRTRGGVPYTHNTPDDKLEGAWYDNEVAHDGPVVHEVLVIAEDDDEADW